MRRSLNNRKDCWKYNKVANLKQKKLLAQDESKLKWVIAKQPLLTSAQIFEKAEIKGVKDKRCRILCKLESVKTFPRKPPVTKANILKCQNWAKKYMKINFCKVFFTDESWVTFDRPDGWAKG